MLRCRSGGTHRWDPREHERSDRGENGSSDNRRDRVDDREEGDEQRATDEDHLLQRSIEGVRRLGAVLTRDRNAGHDHA